MAKLAWMTDVHLNFINDLELAVLIRRINLARPTALLLGGDIAEAPSLEYFLRELDANIDCPVYFVLGNHDYYKGSIAEVRAKVEHLHDTLDNISWLPRAGVVELTPQTALVGHGGWGDARFGDFVGSTVMLNDYLLIRELAGIRVAERQRRLQQLGDEAAVLVRTRVSQAAKRYPNLIFLTHVPPFREACVYEGKISDDNWLPHFSCKAVGIALRDVMTAHPECTLTVLCGHTHGAGEAQILPNLFTRTGAAEYGAPEIQQPLLLVA